MFEELFSDCKRWQQREGGFYQCRLREVTEEIPADFLSEIIERMRKVTELPLIDKCVVTAQQMMPGHIIGIHSDRPLVGYEIARLVVQFNKEWQLEDGGVLKLFLSPDEKAVFDVYPRYNEAFGFVLHEKSYHAVTRVNKLRQTIVFNFWHAANTPELENYVKTLFSNIHFSELPASLNCDAVFAESTLPEEITLLAGTAAVALHRWGLNEATVADGYRYSAGLKTFDNATTEAQSSILLADWLARMYRNNFDLELWKTLKRKLKNADFSQNLNPIWELCFPVIKKNI